MTSRRTLVWLGGGAAFALIFILFAAVFLWPTPFSSEQSRGRGTGYGLFSVDKAASFPGYTLIAPFRWNTVYLLDQDGAVAHEWRLPGMPSREEIVGTPDASFGIFQVRLLPSGNLLAGYRTPADETDVLGGSMPRIVELSWDGEVVWQYRNAKMHHDFWRLPGGRTAVIVQEEIPADIAKQVKGGFEVEPLKGKVFADAIIEIDERGKELWHWATWEHLDPRNPENMQDGGRARSYWTYVDSLVYTEKNPVSGTPAYLVNVNALDSVMLVERETGAILWRGGRGVFGAQHSAVLTRAGNVMVFDNGIFAPGKSAVPVSRVAEIDLERNEVLFQFAPGPFALGTMAYYTPIHGSVEELPNGNILASAGVTGRIFEIERATRRVVWDYRSPFGAPVEGWPSVLVNGVYTAHRYPKGYAFFLR